MTVKIGCIVEGHGDVVAVPLLIRRIAAELHPNLMIETPRLTSATATSFISLTNYEKQVPQIVYKWKKEYNLSRPFIEDLIWKTSQISSLF